MARFILAIDQGTTGSTALVLSTEAQVLGRATCEFPQHFPHPGWVEHEPAELWDSVLHALAEAMISAGVRAEDCAAIGVTNQRETALIWERENGRPIHRAIVWQDRRTTERCEQLRAAGHETLIRDKTGLVLDPYFSATKLQWLLDNVPHARARADTLYAGTIDTYIAYLLSGKRLHVTDATNASRTLLFDIHRGEWDAELAKLFDVPLNLLPRVGDTAEVYGHTQDVPGLSDGIPIAALVGDQQAALFGQACFAPGDAKCTYGTGAFLLMNIGTTPVSSQQGLLCTVAWRLQSKLTYALEGSAFNAGAAVQWLRDGLHMITNSSQIETLAAQVESSLGVIFVPALTGLGAPHWDPHARGLILGLSRGTTDAHLARATLEGISMQIVELANAMQQDAARSLCQFRVDGGASQNNLLMQIQADLLGLQVCRPAMVETTALGAAFLAGLATGIYRDDKEISKNARAEADFEPIMSSSERDNFHRRWKQAVALSRSKVD